MQNIPINVDEYIDQAQTQCRKHLLTMREIVRKAAPEATEVISWGMPSYKQLGIVVQFGGFKNHISLFPGSEAIETFADKLTGLTTSKGTIQFKLDSPLPEELIIEIVKFRVHANLLRKAKK